MVESVEMNSRGRIQGVSKLTSVHKRWSLKCPVQKHCDRDQKKIDQGDLQTANFNVSRTLSCNLTFDHWPIENQVIKQSNTLFAGQKSWSWSQTLQVTYKWLPLSPVSDCTENAHRHASLSTCIITIHYPHPLQKRKGLVTLSITIKLLPWQSVAVTNLICTSTWILSGTME